MEGYINEELLNELRNHDFSIRIRNEKIKAKVTDYAKIYQVAEMLSGGPPEEIYQEEIYYRVPKGRLKIRFNEDRSATLLRYNREDLPTRHERLIKHLNNGETLEFNADDARKLHRHLLANLGTCGGILKERRMFKVDQTIIYLDTIEDLGQFVKLEVVRRPGQQPEDLQVILRQYRNILGIEDEDITTCPYVDMNNEMI